MAGRRKKNSIDYPEVINQYYKENELVFEPVKRIGPKMLEKQGYKKLPDDIAGRASAVFQFVPNTLAIQMTAAASDRNMAKVVEGAYRAILPHGTHMGNSRKTAGLFSGTIFGENGLAGTGEFEKIDPIYVSRLPQAVAAVYSVAAIVTSQYYLSEINKNIESLQHGINDIKQFLFNEKRAQVWADEQILDQIIRRFGNIMEDPIEKQAVLANLIDMERNALASIKFYQYQIEHKLNQLPAKFVANGEVKENITELIEYLPEQCSALLMYEKIEIIKTFLLDKTDDGYLDIVVSDMSKYKDIYVKTFEQCEDRLQTYICSKRKGAVGFFDGILSRISKETYMPKPAKDMKEYIDRMLSGCGNYKPIEKCINSVEQYRVSLNYQTELLQYKGSVYFRHV